MAIVFIRFTLLLALVVLTVGCFDQDRLASLEEVKKSEAALEEVKKSEAAKSGPLEPLVESSSSCAAAETKQEVTVGVDSGPLEPLEPEAERVTVGEDLGPSVPLEITVADPAAISVRKPSGRIENQSSFRNCCDLGPYPQAY